MAPAIKANTTTARIGGPTIGDTVDVLRRLLEAKPAAKIADVLTAQDRAWLGRIVNGGPRVSPGGVLAVAKPITKPAPIVKSNKR